MTTTNEGLMKLDCIGRIRFSREQREALLDGYEASGLSGPQFCAQHGVKYQTFATWLQKRKRGDGRYPMSMATTDSKPVFLLAGVEAAAIRLPAPRWRSGFPVDLVYSSVMQVKQPWLPNCSSV